MKHLLILSTCFIALLTSCNSNYDVETFSNSSIDILPPVVVSTIESEQYTAIRDSLLLMTVSSSRAIGEELSEEEAMRVLEPFAIDGKQICKQILNQQEILELSTEEIGAIANLTPEECAELSIIVSSMDDELYANNNMIKTQDVIDCIGLATGVTEIVDFAKDVIYGGGKVYTSLGFIYSGTKQLMTATTAKSIVVALAKRYVGWIGIAWMMVDFTDCIHSKSR